MTRIAFLGLGAMGSRMAAQLAAAGHDVTGWNRSSGAAPELSIRRAEYSADAVKDAEVVITMVTDDAASQAVWDEVLPSMAPDALAVEMSTVSTTRIADLAAQTEARGLAFLDAPVAGSRPQAEAGALAILTGGDEYAVARFAPVAEALGTLVHAGTVRQGAVLKMLVNALLAVQTAALAELLPWAEAHGMEVEKAIELLAPIPVTSPAATFVAKQIAAGQHDPLFTVDLLVKDLGYLLTGGTVPLMSAVRQRFEAAQERGLGDRHITAVAA